MPSKQRAPGVPLRGGGSSARRQLRGTLGDLGSGGPEAWGQRAPLGGGLLPARSSASEGHGAEGQQDGVPGCGQPGHVALSGEPQCPSAGMPDPGPGPASHWKPPPALAAQPHSADPAWIMGRLGGTEQPPGPQLLHPTGQQWRRMRGTGGQRCQERAGRLAASGRAAGRLSCQGPGLALPAAPFLYGNEEFRLMELNHL